MPTLPGFSVNKKGFTLIELLLVITIIGILSVVGMVAYNGLNAKARDTKIKGDIDAIAQAYELRYNRKEAKYEVLTENDFTSGIPKRPDGKEYDLLKNKAEAFRICVNLSDGKSYCKDSLRGDLSTLPQPPTGGGDGSGGGGGSPVTTTKAFDCENFGDVNQDGKLSLDDVTLISNFNGGKVQFSDDQKFLGDVNDSDINVNLDVLDSLHLDNYIKDTGKHLKVCGNAKSSPCGTLGDVTGDGKVTNMDRYEIGLITLGSSSLYTNQPFTQEQRQRADVNGDGQIKLIDSSSIGQYLSGSIITFPACP